MRCVCWLNHRKPNFCASKNLVLPLAKLRQELSRLRCHTKQTLVSNKTSLQPNCLKYTKNTLINIYKVNNSNKKESKT